MNCFDDLESYSSETAIINQQFEQISYKELIAAADRIGEEIKKRCLIFIVCKNRLESMAGYIGFMRANAAVILINDKIHNIQFQKICEAFRPEYIYLPTENLEGLANYSQIYSFHNYTLAKTDYIVDYTLHEDLSLVLTTSGSTGGSKFVRLSNNNIKNNAIVIAEYLKITGDDRPITTMPMSYSYGLSIINSHLLKGATIILNEASLMEKKFWEAIKIDYASTFGGVPYTYEMLKKLRFEKMNFPNLKYITQAGGKLNLKLFNEFCLICERKNIAFYTMYGQTEATARMSYLPWNYAGHKSGSIGTAILGGKFWLEDDKGRVINESNIPGELVYQGENVSLGYADNRFDLCKGDENKGVLRTGDIARRDEDDFYYIVGRKKRFLKIFGNRVNLDDIEYIIKTAGYDCACAGTDDNLKIFVTNRNDIAPISKHISNHTRINKTGFDVLLIDEIPRSEAGKIQYFSLD